MAKTGAAGGARTKKEATKTAVLYRLNPEHVEALRAEAFKRAAARGSGKPDASEVLREVLDAWLKRRGK